MTKSKRPEPMIDALADSIFAAIDLIPTVGCTSKKKAEETIHLPDLSKKADEDDKARMEGDGPGTYDGPY